MSSLLPAGVPQFSEDPKERRTQMAGYAKGIRPARNADGDAAPEKRAEDYSDLAVAGLGIGLILGFN